MVVFYKRVDYMKYDELVLNEDFDRVQRLYNRIKELSSYSCQETIQIVEERSKSAQQRLA